MYVTAWMIVLLMAAAAFGAGAAVLRIFCVNQTLGELERVAYAFVLGIGILGWLGFFMALGHAVSPAAVGVACGVCLGGLIYLAPNGMSFRLRSWSARERLLVAVFGLVLTFNFVAGLAPPADADSLAYHFAIPKSFAHAGGLSFEPRANDGAVPLLQQMTYMMALVLGGEAAMTAWATVSSWAPSLLLFCISRRYLSRSWSLAIMIAFATTPAVVYGTGTGQVEIRNAAFALLAAVVAAESIREENLGLAAIAGLAAGFYAASKYPGLLFILPLGVAIMCQRRWFFAGVTFAAMAFIAGGQWYLWNWWHTGDPVFPMLHGLLPYQPGLAWNSVQDLYLKTVFPAAERPLPANLWGLLVYPFKLTFDPVPFEADRTGFGPLPMLLLPFALVGLAFNRTNLTKSRLLVPVLAVMTAFTLWFFMGPSQRARFLLPLYPIVLLCLVAVSVRVADQFDAMKPAVGAAMALTILLQIAGHAVFSINYLRYALTSESRDEFLTRNVNRYAAAIWLNRNLSADDRVLNTFREINYLIDVPYFYAHEHTQAMIEIRPDNKDLKHLWDQLRRERITHMFVGEPSSRADAATGIPIMVERLAKRNCAQLLTNIHTRVVTSRTLDSNGIDVLSPVYRLTPATCPFGNG